ncbi:hypothetical protein ACM66B_005246 [Microbotryomycetes sp. NB124-2]
MPPSRRRPLISAAPAVSVAQARPVSITIRQSNDKLQTVHVTDESTHSQSPSSQARPMTPSSAHHGDAATPSSGSSGGVARSCRALVVNASADEERVTATLYCRLAVPTSVATVASLLKLDQHTTIVSSELYRLSDYVARDSSAIDVDFVRLLGVDRESFNNTETTPAREAGCDGLVIEHRDGQVMLSYEPPASSADSPPASPSPPAASERARSPFSSEAPAPSPSSLGGDHPMRMRRQEWVLLLQIKCSNGPLRLPDFANQVTIPTPVCLKNSLVMKLGPTAGSTEMDLLVKPSLRSSATSTESDGSTLIKGSFAATDKLAIKWTTRSNHALSLRDSQLVVDWTVLPDGSARAVVRGDSVLHYAGLRDKLWLDLLIRHQRVALPDQADEIHVQTLEGTGIVAWELLESQDVEPVIDLVGHSRDSTGWSSTQTPEPKRRPDKMPRDRPPSFTNLFEVAPPDVPQLDSATVAALKEPSLLRQAAPFEGDVSADMTFEAAAANGVDDTLPGVQSRAPPPETDDVVVPDLPPSPEAPDADDDLPKQQAKADADADAELAETRLRIQLDLAHLVQESSMTAPKFSFELVANCSASLLSSPLALLDPAEDEGVRLNLPTFSMPAADHEESTVTVSAPDKVVELLRSNSGLTDYETSPLPMFNGKARWASQRSRGDSESSRPTEIEVSSPRTAYNGIDLDNLDSDGPASPSYRLGTNRPIISPLQNLRTASSRSLRSQSSLSSLRQPSSRLLIPQSLGLVKVRITPVPPQSPQQSWRLFTHLTFNQPFVGQFSLPLKQGQEVTVHDVWNHKHESTTVEAVTHALPDETLAVKIDTTPVKPQQQQLQKVSGVNEMLYSVAVTEEKGQVELGDVLPQIDVKVSSLEVEVQPVAGYELLTDKQAFDTATPVIDGSPARFTKFQLQPSEISRLCVQLQAESTSTASAGRLSPPLVAPASEGGLPIVAETPPLVTMPPTPLVESDLVSDVKLVEIAVPAPDELVIERKQSAVLTFFRWLPVLAVFAAILIGQLSETGGPLNELFIGKPWPNAHLDHEAAVSSFVSTQLLPVVQPVSMSTVPIVKTEQLPSPVVVFQDDFSVPQHTTSLDTSTGPTALVDYVSTLAFEIKMAGLTFMRRLILLLHLW